MRCPLTDRDLSGLSDGAIALHIAEAARNASVTNERERFAVLDACNKAADLLLDSRDRITNDMTRERLGDALERAGFLGR